MGPCRAGPRGNSSAIRLGQVRLSGAGRTTMVVDRYCEHRMPAGPADVAAARRIPAAMQACCGPSCVGAACTAKARPPLTIIVRIASLIIFPPPIDLGDEY